MAKTEKTIEEMILRDFRHSRSSFMKLTDDEYVGYVTASTMLLNKVGGESSISDVLSEVRRLFQAGKI